ncbi:MAG TPA: wax ester/triacylglycerol synthase family O-acyltransferase [Mycobacteriales bacterium]|nr:wax ester/triacylglycerol synthase family O-acyltransferase [Mycobacteriales bacterium]
MDVLSRLDAAFLQAEDADEHVSMAISSVGIFDGAPPTHDELCRSLAARLPLIPRYYQRLRRYPLDVAAPVWVNDPDFDIDFHVRRTAVAAPGGDAELDQLIGRLMAQRLDRNRPLWEMWVVEGMSGGRWALVSKIHHAMADGVGGTQLYHLLLSLTPDVNEADFATQGFVPPPPQGRRELAADALRRTAVTPVHLAGRIGHASRHPKQLLFRAAATAQGLAGLAHAIKPATASTLTGPIERQRRYTSATVSLDDVKRIRSHFPVTINDIAVAAVTAGFRALLLARREEPTGHSVRSLIPTNVRVAGTEGELANRVSCRVADLPVQIADPVSRLRSVHQHLTEAKNLHEAEAGEALVELTEYEPSLAVSAMLRLAFRLPQHNIVTVTTNVPGPPVPLYLLGRKLTRLLPFVPIADRVRVGVAMLSYCEELTFGITGDYGTTADINVLRDAISAEIAALLKAAES